MTNRPLLLLRMIVSAAALSLLPFLGWALDLGNIELRSDLNQPLEADIFILESTPEEIRNLQVRLATPETFELYGVDRPVFLSELEFQIITDNLGQEVIRILSESDVSSPSTTILLDVTWPDGQLLGEYIIEWQTTQSVDFYGPVRQGDTLWSLADFHLPTGVIVNQMMIAMFRANPDAFNGNINLLLEGALLRIPELDEASQIDPNEATQEAIQQTQDWEESLIQTGLRLIPVSDEVSSEAAVIVELETENTVLQTELEETQRLLRLRNSELAELQSRISAMEDVSSIAASPDGSDLAELANGTNSSSVSNVVNPRPEQSTFFSWFNRFLTSPFLLIGIGLLVLVGSAVWYLRHRQRVEPPAIGSWETLEGQLQDSTSETEVIDVAMKLDLGRAYIDMEDSESARKVLEEVIEEGNPTQQEEAKALLVGLLLK